MQPVRPIIVLISLLAALALMLAVSLLFPSSGTTRVGGITLQFPPWSRVLHPKHVKENQNVGALLAKIDTASIVDAGNAAVLPSAADSLERQKRIEERLSFNVVQRLEFGAGSAAVLHSFFSKLKNGQPVRILHYGDSQIEGDRMTGFLRQKLQAQFGGSGVGLVLPSDVYPTNTHSITLSKGWKRYTGFAKVDPSVNHRKYGVMAAFSRFTPVWPDSLAAAQAETEEWLEIGPSPAAYGSAQKMSRIRMFYGNCKHPVHLKVMNDGGELFSGNLVDNGEYQVLDLPVSSGKVKYVFRGKDSPDLYAFSMEGAPGVWVDNIALRGASGTFFNKLDHSLLRRMYDDLGVELFILQFGGNTVPYLKNEEEVENYGSWLASQMRSLKKLRPGADMILIGPSDMATNIDGRFVTYPLLPNVVEAMKQAAFQSGAGFWDMYAAMGGENSMTAWVEKELAGDDYTHFTPAGARYIIQMFYEALMLEYVSFAEP